MEWWNLNNGGDNTKQTIQLKLHMIMDWQTPDITKALCEQAYRDPTTIEAIAFYSVCAYLIRIINACIHIMKWLENTNGTSDSVCVYKVKMSLMCLVFSCTWLNLFEDNFPFI